MRHTSVGIAEVDFVSGREIYLAKVVDPADETAFRILPCFFPNPFVRPDLLTIKYKG